MPSLRIVEVIPGKSVIGIELPNQIREMVSLKEVLASDPYTKMDRPLTMALGHDIAGFPVVVDLAKMPHLLVAGTTGSGKSVGVNAMILSLLYKSSPEDLKMIMIDPKMLELSIYDGIPHLLTPVVTDMNEAASALHWCVVEMERRYKLMAKLGVRNISGYNEKVLDAENGSPLLDPLIEDGSVPETLTKLPYIVVVADEFADMMMMVGKKCEQLIARIAQKARASGIHLILATQRPSVDVITGLIKANIPTRISFQVSSKIDSRTIIDQGGAEQLLGHGDMLYLPPGSPVPIRVHGAFVSDQEVHNTAKYLQENSQDSSYIDLTVKDEEASDSVVDGSVEGQSDDPLYSEAVNIVVKSKKASISNLQRRLKVGYRIEQRCLLKIWKLRVLLVK